MPISSLASKFADNISIAPVFKYIFVKAAFSQKLASKLILIHYFYKNKFFEKRIHFPLFSSFVFPFLFLGGHMFDNEENMTMVNVWWREYT